MNHKKEYENLLIENNDFSIYGDYSLQCLKEDLLTLLSNRKRSLLSFFHLSSYPKVRINLCKNSELYNEFRTRFENEEARISICYNRVENMPQNQLFLFLRFSILNAFIKKLYSSILIDNPLWLETGLAINLSGEKLNIEKSDFSFRNFYLESIVRRDKKIPDSSFFERNSKEEWLKSAKFFDPYDISYLLVHYLLETKNNIYEIISNKNRIEEIEKTIITDCIAYYNGKYPVVENFYAIKNDKELMDYRQIPKIKVTL